MLQETRDCTDSMLATDVLLDL